MTRPDLSIKVASLLVEVSSKVGHMARICESVIVAVVVVVIAVVVVGGGSEVVVGGGLSLLEIIK